MDTSVIRPSSHIQFYEIYVHYFSNFSDFVIRLNLSDVRLLKTYKQEIP